MLGWQTIDPREHFNKRATIVVLVGGEFALFAHVDTKETWAVFFDTPPGFGGDFPDYFRGPDDAWPSGWLWTTAP